MLDHVGVGVKQRMGSGFLGISGLVCMAVFTALLKPVIDNFDKNNSRAAFKWMFFSSIPIGVFALIWSFGGDAHMWQKNLALGLTGAFIGASGFIFAGYALGQNTDTPSPGTGGSTPSGNTTYGTVIHGDSTISATGSPGRTDPVVGGESNVTACPGQSGNVVGTYIPPGGHFNVTASNAGGGSVTGFRSTVTVGGPGCK